MKTLLTPTPLIAIEIPNSYSNFYMDGSLIMSKANSEVIDSFVVGLSPYDKTVILGTVDKGVIDFDCEPYLEKVRIRCDVSVRAAGFIDIERFKNYCKQNQYEHSLTLSEESFNSLLLSNSLSLDKKYLIIKQKN